MYFLHIVTALLLCTVLVGLASSETRLLEFDVDKPNNRKGCRSKDADTMTKRCPLDNLTGGKNYKCWVTSHEYCDGSKYVNEGSVCRHRITAAVKKCVNSQWTPETLATRKSRHRTRRGFWFWSWPWDKEDRNEPPSITCPADIREQAPLGQITSTVNWSPPVATDNEHRPTVARIQGPAPGSEFREGSTLIGYRARDGHGATAECHFTVTVVVKHCRELRSIAHGSRRCSGAQPNVYGSSCLHSCDNGYRIQGSSTVICHQIARQSQPVWSTSFPTCQPVSCGNPGSVSGGRVLCPMGFTFGHNCNILCNAGFRHTGVKFMTCTSTGLWTRKDPCEDILPPKFTNGCPADQNMFSGPLRAPVAVTWTDPVTIDNSREIVTLSSDPVKGSRLGPGVHSVTLIATDTAGNEATCMLNIIIRVRECQAVTTPSNGQVSCTAGHVEGSVCNVSCNHGHRLLGQGTLTCLENESWNNEYPTCQAVFCSTPPDVDHGQFSCPNGHQSPAECTLTCDAGFRVEGLETIQCQENASWTAPGYCKDVESPVFDNGCPAVIQVQAARLGLPTFVNWTPPTVTDNSDDVIQVKSDVTSGSAFLPGTTVVTFEATDSSGNRNVCRTNVTVAVLQCGEPDMQPTTDTGIHPMQDTCPDGYVYGASCTLNCTQGYRLQGRDIITCERDVSMHPPSMTWKWSGTHFVQPQCKEDRCPALTPPKNGALSCYFGDNGWECYMSCEASWDVPGHTEGRFVCFNGQEFWVPDAVPDCTERTLPGKIRILSDVLYFTESCNISMEQLRHNFIARINQSVYSGACASTPSCIAENIEVTCNPGPPRNRRHATFDDKLMTRLHRARRHAQLMTSHVVLVKFHVTMPYDEDNQTPEDAFKHYYMKAANFTGDLKLRARSGQLDVNDLDLVADEFSIGDVLLMSDCPPGTVFRDRQPLARFSCVPF
ncbi:P-selectin-like isoform X2 [Littorina saxatilis]|uniref:P-selectin-like isoform X2 n=1 Tax=Littorina saxatilis TaxID=31220 RepID=UPI0038B58E2C